MATTSTRRLRFPGGSVLRRTTSSGSLPIRGGTWISMAPEWGDGTLLASINAKD